ncbi:MAG: exodeoxyribonuclease III [Gammaproteobacteria bacterium]|nr:MAG: exodeoxyribonuclease III [Gammaproteobacteria bacterium]
MKVVSVNVNGIRASAKKGLFDWIHAEQPDFVCIQETKAQIHQLEDPQFSPAGYHCYYFDAVKKGYSGTAIYAKEKPKKVHTGLGFDIADTEGRYIEAEYGNLSVISLYLPSGSSSEQAQEKKFIFLKHFEDHLRSLRRKRREFIICGDWNIAHKEIDLKNWRPNRKNSGFLPEERQWLDQLIDDIGFVDAFREVDTNPDQYTWWSNRGQAWANNVGWRIDYHFVTPGLKDKVLNAEIYKEQRFSDHAPLTINYDFKVS